MDHTVSNSHSSIKIVDAYAYRHGPLIRMWCMRYEGKHRYFKRWAKIMGNFKNIAKTLAMHHQRNLCYELVGGTSYLHSATTTGPGKLKKIVHQTNLILL